MGMIVRAGIGLGVGAAAVVLPAGVGWFYSSMLMDPTPRPVFPERVLEAGASSVTLVANRLTRQPGTWGLRWPGGLTGIGPVTAERDGAVVRPVLHGTPPPPGSAAVLDTGPWEPDPAARGLRFTDVAVPTPVGECPAWHVPAAGPTWVVLVHGRGGTRMEALRVLPALHALDLPALVVSYRNDIDAPPGPDGRYHLGDTEWRDVEAAVRYALAHGARDVALYGWSMGAAITGALLNRSLLAGCVRAVVWDAPLLDWRATLAQQARIRRYPARLGLLAGLAASRRIGIDLDRFDLLNHPPAVRPPTLVVHSAEDTAVPVGPSRALPGLAGRRGWPVEYVEVAGVEHTASWNADPPGYEAAVTGFLARWVT